MNRNTIEQLKTLRHEHGQINPDRDWVLRNRETLLHQIQNTVETNGRKLWNVDYVSNALGQITSLFLPTQIVAMGRSAAILILVFSMAIGGWITSASAASSLPGEPLYHVKMAKEQTELLVVSVVGTETDKVNTLLQHASNRVEEYQKSKSPAQATQAIQSLKESIQSTKDSLTNISTSDPAATGLAQTVNDKTDQLLQSLSATSTASTNTSTTGILVGTDHTDAVALQKEVGEAAHLIAVTGVKAAEVLVQKNLDGDQSIDLNEVKANVEKKLDTIVTDFSQINKDAAVVASSTSPNSGATTTIPFSLIPVVPASLVSTTVVSTTINANASSTITVAQAIKVTEQTVGDANKIVQKTVAEAKTMIGNNDLLGALQKVQELATVKKDTATVVIDAQAVADTISQSAIQATTSSSGTGIAPVNGVSTTTTTKPLGGLK